MKERKRYIDILKGVGIILVVFGHCNIDGNVKIWIYSFHMPLFFILSGIVYKNKYSNYRDILVNNAKSLLYPYFSLGIIAIVFNTLCGIIENRELDYIMLLKRIVALLYGNCIWENNYDYINTLWFLIALFTTKTVVSIFELTHQNIRDNLVFALFVGAGGSLWCSLYKCGIRLPWCLDISLLTIPFFVCGLILKNYFIKIKHKTIVGVLLLILGTIVAFVNEEYIGTRTDIYGMNIGNPFLFFGSALAISVAFLQLSIVCESLCKLSLLNYLGKQSLLIMAVHLYILKVLNYGSRKLNIQLDNPYILGILLLVGSSAVSYIFSNYFNWVYHWPSRQKTEYE